MNASTATEVALRELDSRISDGIRVRLLWASDSGRVSVAVEDARTGESFSVDVADPARTLDVFHHPFAYAADAGGD